MCTSCAFLAALFCSFGTPMGTPILYIRLGLLKKKKIELICLFEPIFRHSGSTFLSDYCAHIYLFIHLFRVIRDAYTVNTFSIISY